MRVLGCQTHLVHDVGRDPLSPNLSLTPIMRITVGASSTGTSATADPSPPITEWSSGHDRTAVAALMMAPRSIGLMVCMSMTAAWPPSQPAYRCLEGPLDHDATGDDGRIGPSRRTDAFPISRASASSFV